MLYFLPLPLGGSYPAGLILPEGQIHTSPDCPERAG
jgi:hypothetical protein